jgi:hypothetical protein
MAHNLFSVDLIETLDGELKILEAHGNTSSIATAVEAGYKPKDLPIKRYFDYIKRIRGKKRGSIVEFIGASPIPLHLPESVMQWYATLPPGIPQLDWMHAASQHAERLRSSPSETLLSHVRKVRLDRYAKAHNIEFISGVPFEENDDGVYVKPMDSDNKQFVPYESIACAGVFGNALWSYPSRLYDNPDASNIPFFNDPRVQYALTGERPKWLLQSILHDEGESFSHLFPREIVHGMGMSSAADLLAFRDATRQTKGIRAVRKPLCMHRAIGLSYLPAQQLDDLIRAQDKIDHTTSREQIKEGIMSEFSYAHGERTDRDMFRWGGAGENTMLFPVIELGATIIQEFLEPKPVVSSMTGMLHQGPIRLFMFDNKVLAAYRRLPCTPYDPARFVPVTDYSVKTFFERVDDATEERLGNTVRPVLQQFVRNVKAYNLAELGIDKKSRLLAFERLSR